jgi:hypothetical protein
MTAKCRTVQRLMNMRVSTAAKTLQKLTVAQAARQSTSPHPSLLLHFVLVYLTTLSAAQSVRRRMVPWLTMNCNRRPRKDRAITWVVISAFTEQHWGKPRNPSVRTHCLRVDIWSQDTCISGSSGTSSTSGNTAEANWSVGSCGSLVPAYVTIHSLTDGLRHVYHVTSLRLPSCRSLQLIS